MRALLGLCAVCCLDLTGCGSDHPSPGPGGDDVDAAVAPVDTDPLSGLPTGVEQWTALCAKHYGDMISAKFCAGSAPPSLTSLADLEALLGLTVRPNPTGDPTINANVRVTLNGESTGLGLRSVNPITPRVFLMTPSPNAQPNPSYQVLAFSRGEPLVELVANDPAAGTLRFFAVRFHPACEAAALGCNAADLLTPAIESGWTGYTLYDDEALANTTLDCLACHQPRGPGTPKMLRMQEVLAPWTHWVNEVPTGAFLQTHGAESYAGFPSGERMSSPMLLQR